MSAEYWANISDNNVVTNVMVVTKEYMDENPDMFPGRWVQTFVDREDKTYAGIGFTWDEAKEDFVMPPLVFHP